MAYQKGDEKKYFPMVFIILAVVAMLAGALIYSFVRGRGNNSDVLYVETENGIDPGEGLVPDGPPEITPPSTPPSRAE